MKHWLEEVKMISLVLLFPSTSLKPIGVYLFIPSLSIRFFQEQALFPYIKRVFESMLLTKNAYQKD